MGRSSKSKVWTLHSPVESDPSDLLQSGLVIGFISLATHSCLCFISSACIGGFSIRSTCVLLVCECVKGFACFPLCVLRLRSSLGFAFPSH